MGAKSVRARKCLQKPFPCAGFARVVQFYGLHKSKEKDTCCNPKQSENFYRFVDSSLLIKTKLTLGNLNNLEW
jgi:hypothetical protein